MQTSEAINELGKALAAFQAEAENASKDAKNPHFKNTYASLASVREAGKPMHKHGLSVVQTVRAEGPAVTVETMLLHTSGQWLRDALTMQARDAGPQAIGSCITYARRYALAAVLGIASEDDDAEAAQGRGEPKTGYTVPAPTTVVDTTTGEEVAPERADAPKGYHYLTGYKQNGEWHEAVVLKWDLQGGGLRVSTKRQALGDLLRQFCQDGVPVAVDVTVKKNTKGEAYLNAIRSYSVAQGLNTPQAMPAPEITAADIAFAPERAI